MLIRVLILIRKEHIEAIHAHQRFPIWLTSFAGLFLNIPVVATVHGMTDHDLRSNFVRKRVAKVIVVNRNISNINNCDITSSVICERYAQEVSPHFKNADLVIGVGRVVIESLSHGVPSLSVKYNHLGPIITRDNFEDIALSNFVAVNYPPLDAVVLLNSLEDFIDRKEYYYREVAHLQSLVASRYNIRDTVKTTVELYRSVLIAQ